MDENIKDIGQIVIGCLGVTIAGVLIAVGKLDSDAGIALMVAFAGSLGLAIAPRGGKS